MTYPYTYKIGWSKHNKFYYGVRIANILSPENDLWIKYFTSSKVVAEFRKQNGEPDIILIDQYFDDNNKAILYESNHIKENKLHLDEAWLNQACYPAINSAGIPRTEEQKRHQSMVMKGKNKGQIPWNKGLDKSDPRVARNARHIKEAKKDIPPWNKGLKEDPEVTKKRSIALTGRKMSKESSEKKSVKLKGRPSPFKGCNHSIESRYKMSESSKGPRGKYHIKNKENLK